MIGLSIRDRKGREVGSAALHDFDFHVETAPALALVADKVRVEITHSGRGPYTWHLRDLSGEVVCDARLRTGDRFTIPTLRVYLTGGAA